MAKIILNGCWGGYGWSDQALAVIAQRTGVTYHSHDVPRDDAAVISILEELGSEFCSGPSSLLRVESYDSDLFTASISDYDGQESLELWPSLAESTVRSCGSMDEVIALLRRAGVIRQETPTPAPHTYSADEYECVYSTAE